MSEFIQQACSNIKSAGERSTPLIIRGGGTKSFYGRDLTGEILDVREYRGVVDYEPSELVVTVKAGTPLKELERLLNEQGQMLAFEPPYFGDDATVGGTVACGLSGPRRPFTGALRDMLLGCRIINGRGEDLSFGGKVIKNVAGYDVSRLMAGSLGTLGVLLEVSLKVLPKPLVEITRTYEYSEERALKTMTAWAGQPHPISATCYCQGVLYVRLSGSETGVTSAASRLGGETLDDDNFWLNLKEHRHEFFDQGNSLWRLSITSNSPALNLQGQTLLEWNGGLRWLSSEESADKIRQQAEGYGGHATYFRGHDGDSVFHPLDPIRLKLHRNLKQAFDPHGVLNPGRMYPEI